MISTIPDDEQQHTKKSAPSKRRLWPVAVTLLAAAGVAAAALNMWGTDAHPPAAQPSTAGKTEFPTAIAAEPTAPTEEGALTVETATEVVQHIIATPFVAVESAADLEAQFTPVASGAYLAELEAQWQELVAWGWHIEGVPEVLFAEVGEVRDGRVRVTACVDTSEVQLRDAEGTLIGEPQQQPPALHEYTLAQEQSGSWRIEAHTLPDNPVCNHSRAGTQEM